MKWVRRYDHSYLWNFLFSNRRSQDLAMVTPMILWVFPWYHSLTPSMVGVFNNQNIFYVTAVYIQFVGHKLLFWNKSSHFSVVLVITLKAKWQIQQQMSLSKVVGFTWFKKFNCNFVKLELKNIRDYWFQELSTQRLSFKYISRFHRYLSFFMGVY